MAINCLKYDCHREFLQAYMEQCGFGLTEFSKHLGGALSKASLSLLFKKDAKGNYLKSHSLSDICWARIVDKLDLSLEEKQHLLMIKLAEDIALRSDTPSLTALANSLKSIQRRRNKTLLNKLVHPSMSRARALEAILDFLPARFRRPIFSEVRAQIQRSKEANRYEAARIGLSRYEAEFRQLSKSLEA